MFIANCVRRRKSEKDERKSKDKKLILKIRYLICNGNKEKKYKK